MFPNLHNLSGILNRFISYFARPEQSSVSPRFTYKRINRSFNHLELVMRTITSLSLLLFTITALCLLFAQPAWAHCDSMDGPVISDAKRALEAGNPAPALKWVSAENESQVTHVFEQTLRVRELGGEARSLADRYFFETLVRVHRAGEGEPYTGLKEAGSVDEGILVADRALETNTGKALAGELSKQIEAETISRFEQASAARQIADNSVDSGREFVEAYVNYIHFVEAVQNLGRKHTAQTKSAQSHDGHSAHQH